MTGFSWWGATLGSTLAVMFVWGVTGRTPWIAIIITLIGLFVAIYKTPVRR